MSVRIYKSMIEIEENVNKEFKEMGMKIGCWAEEGMDELHISTLEPWSLDMKKLGTLYKKEESVRLMEFHQILMDTLKALELWTGNAGVKMTVKYSPHNDKVVLAKHSGTYSMKGLSKAFYEHLEQIGYGYEAKEMQMKEVFSKEEAMEVFRELKGKINKKERRAREQIEIDLGQRIRSIRGRASTQMKIVNETNRKMKEWV